MGFRLFLVAAAAATIAAFPGPSPLLIRWHTPVGEGTGSGAAPGETLLRSRKVRIAPAEALVRELREVFGERRVRLVRHLGS